MSSNRRTRRLTKTEQQSSDDNSVVLNDITRRNVPVKKREPRRKARVIAVPSGLKEILNELSKEVSRSQICSSLIQSISFPVSHWPFSDPRLSFRLFLFNHTIFPCTVQTIWKKSYSSGYFRKPQPHQLNLKHLLASKLIYHWQVDQSVIQVQTFNILCK